MQKLTQQQMLAVKLLEMPITELEQNIQAEIDDNPAIESSGPEDAADYPSETSEDRSGETADDSDDYGETEREEREDRESALDDALSNIGMDDQMPDAASPSPYASADTADYEEMVYGEQTSFYDSLKSQMVDVDLDDTGRQVMEYIIGSLDSDGLLRKSADSIATSSPCTTT